MDPARIGRSAAARLAAGPAGGPLRALAHRGLLPDRVWRRLPAPPGRPFEVAAGAGSFRYEPAEGDRIARRLLWRGLAGFEPESTSAFVDLVRSARTVVDVGAHTGVYTLAALAANPAASVVAVEAVPRTFARLERNVTLNGWTGRCRLVQAAATDDDGPVALVVPDVPLPPSAHLRGAQYRSDAGSVVEVAGRRVDSLVGDADVVKIDVEGAEHLVLAGMTGLASRPVVLLEIHAEGPVAEIQAWVDEHGYRVRHLRAAGGAVPVDRIVPDPSRRDRNFVLEPG